MTATPRLAIVGCGALGSFYGARLLRSGLDVTFLLRSDYDVVARDGVRILDAQGGFVVRPRVARDPREPGPVDLVVIGLKTTANDQLAPLVGPLVGANTLVLTLQNGLGNEEALSRLFGPERVLGGLCFVCLNRTAPGVIHHLAHGRVVMGEHRRPASDRLHQVAGWFQASGVRCDPTDDLGTAHWEKLVWNIPFNGLGVAGAAGYEAVRTGKVPPNAPLGPCLGTEALLGDARWAALVEALMHEVIQAAQTLHYRVRNETAAEQMELTRQMGPYRASTLIDFERGLPIELESIFGEPLRQGRAAGLEMPRLTALVSVLRHLDARRHGAGPAGNRIQ